MSLSPITTIPTSCKNSYFIHIFTLFHIQITDSKNYLSHSPPVILSKPPSETSIFRTPAHKTLKNTILSKQIPPQQAIHQTDKHKIRTLTHASSGRRKTRTFTFSAFKSRHHDDSCTSSRAIQKTTVVISGNHRAASGEGPR